MNNTELLIIDGSQPGANVTYVCNDGYAVNLGGIRSTVIAASCEIKTDSGSPTMSWNAPTSICNRK